MTACTHNIKKSAVHNYKSLTQDYEHISQFAGAIKMVNVQKASYQTIGTSIRVPDDVYQVSR